MVRREFDYVTKQDVQIELSPIDNTICKITLLTNNDILCYQVWNDKNWDINTKRICHNISPQLFVSSIFEYNTNNLIPYEPSTVIEIDNVFYPVVMIRTELDNIDRAVFYFKLNSIKNIDDIKQNYTNNTNNTNNDNTNNNINKTNNKCNCHKLDNNTIVDNMIPLGLYSNVRFDIDSLKSISSYPPCLIKNGIQGVRLLDGKCDYGG